MLKSAMSFRAMRPRKLLKSIIVLIVTASVSFILCPVRYVETNMRDQPQRGLGSDGKITSLDKGKLREGKIVCKNIFMITS